MDSLLVKVCGIRTREEARAAVAAGADALGFNFYPPSPRFLRAEEARQILEALPEGVLRVAVLVAGSGPALTEPFLDQFDVVQVHGLESPAGLPAGRRIWVATDPEGAARFPGFEVLIDPSWGRGEQADWERVARLGRPFFLSGGLTPENVAHAIRVTGAAGVDVCSGVESQPGVKDPRRVKLFIQQARQAAQEIP